MNHNDFREMIQFYLYDELESDKKIILEEHLKTCNECRQEFESYKEMFAKISLDANEELDPKLLMEARLELRGLIKAERDRKSFLSKLNLYLLSFFNKPVGFAFSGVVIMMIGFLLGYFVFNSQPVKSVVNNFDDFDPTKITNINFIDPDPSDGQVEFTFDAVKHNHVKGNINDPELQNILTYSILNAQNPGTRLNSISVINAMQSNKFDSEVKSALITVAKFDDNPGVRIEALKSLKVIPMDEDIKSTLIYVLLNDTSSGIRIEAINSLVNAAKKGFTFNNNDLSLLRKKAQVDKNTYVRFQAKNIIKEY